jgi:hypothetical protein
MIEFVMYILLFAVLAGAGFVGYVFLTGQLSGFSGGGSLFGPKAEKRLDLVEQMSIDARRRLVLIRRDDVEHLIMTGGPVDVVIETGIGEKPVAQRSTAEAPSPVYTRQPRAFGVAQPATPTSGAAE